MDMNQKVHFYRKDYYKKNICFIDVGCNWGYHSIIAIIEFNSKVIAIDANDNIIQNSKFMQKQLNLVNFEI